jgi:hypothetical protein
MIGRSRLWQIGAALFVIINVGGAGFAVAMGEPMHAATHAVLLVVGYGAYLTWRTAARARKTNTQRAQLEDPRVDYLQQSVDAIALEVERIGEAQRFSEKLRSEKGEPPPTRKDQ